jgi:hypothetical protein
MAHRIILSPKAKADLKKLPSLLRAHVVAEIRRLAANPVALSRPSVFPHPQNCQQFRPDPVDLDDGRHEFMVLFRYGQDESPSKSLVLATGLLSSRFTPENPEWPLEPLEAPGQGRALNHEG